MFLDSDIAILLCEKKQYKEAIRLQKQSLAYAKRHAFRDSCRIMLGLGYTLFKSGNLSEGKETMLKAERLLDSLGTIMQIIGNKINLSEYYAYVGDTLASIRFARGAKEKAYEWHLPVDRLNALKRLLLVDKQNRNLLTTEYLNLSDSLQLAERRNRNKFAQIEYQTSELKEQNQHLLTQNQKIIIGASSVGVLLLGGLFARHYRARKKEVQLLRERQAADDEIFQLLHQQQEKVEEGRKLEKRRISQELHDGVMGKLSGIRLNLFVLNKRSDPETVSKCLGHIDKIQEVEKEIRSIAYDLENDLFGEDRSFSALLRTLVQSAKEVSTTQFHLDLDAAIQWDAIPNTVKIQLYRVLQEALTNIRKYAQAKAVHITLRQRKQNLWVRVADDGVGFHPAKVKKGLGLDNMENRIRRQGGNFKAKSAEGRGTTLLFTLPTLTKESHRDDE
ncbi:MAG TPA: ATP-binding protein [Flavobacterium sp.]|nr:ATP-binding protein [Flavobacterium sp.]